jgi:hypothetical protein
MEFLTNNTQKIQNFAQQDNRFFKIPHNYLLFLFIALIIYSVFFNKFEGFASDLTIENISNSINKERTLRNLLSLESNQKLHNAAQIKAQDMIDRHYFSHTDPEGNYIWPTITAQGYAPYLQLGENLAIEFFDTESLVAAWMNSPTHRANVLNEGFKDQGMGVAFGDAQKNEYASSVANTFGTLAETKPKVEANATPPQNTQAKPVAQTQTQTKQTKSPQSGETQLPQKEESKPATNQQTPSQNNANKAVALRGPETVPQKVPTSTEPNTQYHTSSSRAKISTSSPILSQIGFPFGRKLNRYFLLGFGLLVILVLTLDLSSKLRFGILDKKINNLTALILALIVVALLYWF